jgi:hypothetical protein
VASEPPFEEVSTPSPPLTVSPISVPQLATPTVNVDVGGSATTSLRRSGRHQAASDGSMATDEDCMKKVMHIQPTRNLEHSQGYLPVYSLSPVVAYSSETGTPRPVYGGLLAVGASGEGYGKYSN